MAYSFIEIIADGINKLYEFTIPYLDTDDVRVYVNGTSVPFTWTNATHIDLDTLPAENDRVLIRRETSIITKRIDFKQGNINNKDALNLAILNNFYAIQELMDMTGQYDAAADTMNFQGKRLVDLATAILPTDAVSWGQFQTMIDYYLNLYDIAGISTTTTDNATTGLILLNWVINNLNLVDYLIVNAAEEYAIFKIGSSQYLIQWGTSDTPDTTIPYKFTLSNYAVFVSEVV
jgi:hypothetical protein